MQPNGEREDITLIKHNGDSPDGKFNLNWTDRVNLENRITSEILDTRKIFPSVHDMGDSDWSPDSKSLAYFDKKKSSLMRTLWMLSKMQAINTVTIFLEIYCGYQMGSNSFLSKQGRMAVLKYV